MTHSPEITVGSRVRIVDAPGRPTNTYALREQRNAEGDAEGNITSIHVVSGQTRCVVRFDDGSQRYWFYADELRVIADVEVS